MTGDALDSARKKDDGANDEWNANEDHNRELPGKVDAHRKAGNHGKWGLQVVGEPGVDRCGDLSSISNDARREAANVVFLIKAHGKGLDVLKILLAQVTADANGENLGRVAACE